VDLRRTVLLKETRKSVDFRVSFLFSSTAIPELPFWMMDLHARSNRMDPWVGIGMNVDIPSDPHPVPRPMVD
jgi:hypothetical protein